jgi:DNA replication protein DnaC
MHNIEILRECRVARDVNRDHRYHSTADSVLNNDDFASCVLHDARLDQEDEPSNSEHTVTNAENEITNLIHTSGLQRVTSKTSPQIDDMILSLLKQPRAISLTDAILLEQHKAHIDTLGHSKRPEITATTPDSDALIPATPCRFQHPILSIEQLATDPSRMTESVTHLNNSYSSQQIIQHSLKTYHLEDNAEQSLAFSIIADHILNTKHDDNQLLMHLSGMAGTGKTHVVKAVINLFHQLNRSSEILISASTGIAAVLIGGYTIHSLTFLPKAFQKRLETEELQELWANVRYLVIDEISMIPAELLADISHRLCIAKFGADSSEKECKPFGGLNVIFTGELGQLKPVNNISLFSHELVKKTANSYCSIFTWSDQTVWRIFVAPD